MIYKNPESYDTTSFWHFLQRRIFRSLISSSKNKFLLWLYFFVSFQKWRRHQAAVSTNESTIIIINIWIIWLLHVSTPDVSSSGSLLLYQIAKLQKYNYISTIAALKIWNCTYVIVLMYLCNCTYVIWQFGKEASPLRMTHLVSKHVAA